MRQLLGGQLLPGMDPSMTAPQPKSAITGESAPPPPPPPAPAAPAANAPRGNGSAAPVAPPAPPSSAEPPTVVGQAAHQPTQVSPVATQAQPQRGSAPTNGGAPAAGGNRQAASNKADDEDWWTE